MYGAAAPRALLPQQATVPSVRTPHVWSQPWLTETKVPAGLAMPPSLLPQQATVPSVLTPHVSSNGPAPALTEVNVPVGGAASP